MVELENVHKYFYKGTEREVHALDGISLSIEEGEFSVITGQSGCGKTTLLNVIGALDSVNSGSIMIDGEDITKLNQDQRADLRLHQIGFVFQAYNLVPVLSVAENIGFVMKLQGYGDEEIQRRIKEVAQILEIDHKLTAMPNQLSGGQQQRVAVARAVATKPKLVLADEPTANLDSKNSQRLMEMMLNLNQIENTTILFASHDEYVVEMSRRQIILSDGHVEKM
ncbi:ABC transporter ATP-binding protein [Sulfurovum sp. zt1-1]|uniref:ABC transporter ATP-binding protein n=1 Tax=Sulfurovum zhangzhouensis TaxID=3019067 RepID=A0ABT7QVV8_9BACT|nr:ABC transporter ATP-binding protein [Sulfurovum zhangzhouensis]MDM5270975.1 ABC transporter ATP-binding protein [Sulfurovum zhangzhouensis]